MNGVAQLSGGFASIYSSAQASIGIVGTVAGVANHGWNGIGKGGELVFR